MNHCPICWTHRKLRSFKGEIQWWWTYKVKKEPEPNVRQVLLETLPTILSATIGLQLAKKLHESYEKALEKTR